MSIEAKFEDEPNRLEMELREFLEEWFGDEYTFDYYFYLDEKKKVIEFYKSLYKDACRHSLSPQMCMKLFMATLDMILSRHGYRKVGVKRLKVKKKAIEKLRRYGFTEEAIKNLGKLKVVVYRQANVKNE